MPKSDLFGICLIKCMPSIANVFFFEEPTPNGQHRAVYRIFTVQMNAVCRISSATCPHQHLSHFHMPHLAFMYRCRCGLKLHILQLMEVLSESSMMKVLMLAFTLSPSDKTFRLSTHL